MDKLVLAYFAFMAAMLLAWWDSVPHAGWLLAMARGRLGAVGLRDQTPQPHHLALPELVPRALRSFLLQRDGRFPALGAAVVYDQQLADLDQRIWGLQPGVWLAPDSVPGLHRIFAVDLHVFCARGASGRVSFVAPQRRYAEFQYYAFLIALGYLVSYLGYVLVPARGPRFLLKDFDHLPLHGLWLFQGMQSTLDKLESVAYDAFPSGHTELTILAWWSSRTVSNRWFGAYFAYTLSIIFATVYLRYHYTVDVFAGAIVAVILIAATPFLYRRLQ